MYIPAPIRAQIDGQPYTLDSIGMSGARILCFPDKVLKISPLNEEAEDERRMMDWLSGRLPVPKLLDALTENRTSYLLMSRLEGIDWEQLLRRVTDSIDTVLVNAVGAVSATVNIVVTASFALIISVYMSVGSESLCHHARTLVCAYLKPSHSAWLLKFCRLFRQSFANFLTGQCSEAVILGVLMALAFSVFKIPYGSLVGMLTAICAIIPYVGALISCVVSVFLVLLVDPVLAVRCLIVYLAVQFIENQFIYPRVVGKSVGLSPLYTLVAAMIGGELFGIIGIIFFIPLTAVIIELVKEDACRRIQAREPQRSGPSEQ